MKMNWIAAATLTAVVMGPLGIEARAGDREWAVAGKVLTGVVAAGVISRALEPAPCAPTTVVMAAPVMVAPPPVVVMPAPVYYRVPPPVVVSAPVVVPAPVHYHHVGRPHRRVRGHAAFCW
jgi:hypothetical protein